MKKLQFTITIQASVAQVYDFMLGISNKSTYEQWVSLFNPTSTYEGTWEQGSKILFVGVDSNGERGGLVSRIVENRAHQFVSIQHYGMLKGDQEITSGPDVEKWANGLETYSFEENNGATTVTVHLDTPEEFADWMGETYVKALDKLKEICES